MPCHCPARPNGKDSAMVLTAGPPFIASRGPEANV
jgi:hypothetical protein